MQFLKIRRLKADLATGPLSAGETAKYLAAHGALLSVVYVPSSTETPPDWSFLVYPLISIAGVYYCYRCSGGAAGVRFAERYLSIGWVVGMRVVLVIVLAALTAVVIDAFTAGETGWFEHPRIAMAIDLGVAALMAYSYWATGRHLTDVDRMTSRAD